VKNCENTNGQNKNNKNLKCIVVGYSIIKSARDDTSITGLTVTFCASPKPRLIFPTSFVLVFF
jgi:hypothetical protein